MCITLLEHNIIPYEKLTINLLYNKKVAYTSATGTGKSFVVGKWIEDHNLEEKTLFLSPSSIIRASWHKMFPKSQLGMYQTLDKIDLTNIRCVICDEFHHLGSDIWGDNFIELVRNFDGYLIGLSATPIRYLDSSRNMSQELFNDNEVQGCDLAKAINDGILPTCDYHIGMYTCPARLGEKRNERTERLFQKLDIEMSKNSIYSMLGKYNGKKNIVFVSFIESFDEVQSIIKKCFPNAKQFVIHSEQSRKKNDIVLNDFKNCNEQCFLFTVSMLNEGLHIAGVDGVIMFRKTVSPTVWKQQIGRALAVGDKERVQIWDMVANLNSVKKKFASDTDICRELAVLNNSISVPKRQILVDDHTVEISKIIEKIDFLSDNKWNDEEIQILIDHFESSSDEELETLLPRHNISGIRTMAYKIRLSKNKYLTTEQIEFVKANYSLYGPKYIHQHFPDKSLASIMALASRLNLKRSYKWTSEEIEKLKEMYPIKTVEEICSILNKTPQQVKTKANNLHIIGKRTLEASWSEEDIAKVKELYETTSAKEIASLLGKSTAAVFAFISKNKLTKKNPNWTSEEDEILKRNYPQKNLREISSMLNRSFRAVKCRVTVLGISRPSKVWSSDEMAQLVSLIPSHSANEIANIMNRSYSSVKCQINKYWFQSEIDLLSANKLEPIEVLKSLLPNHSPSVILKKLKEINQ